jgi:predicted glycosyltransferase
MKILIYLSHPAQYHFYKPIVFRLKMKNHSIKYFIRTKDVLEQLLINNKEKYINILPEMRKSTKYSIFISFIKRIIIFSYYINQYKPNLMLGSDASISILGKMLSIPVFSILEDDAEIIPYLAKLSFPFTSLIIAPSSCDCGSWNSKKISYEGYMKLSYLHPKIFKIKKMRRRYILIRLSALDAHHDFGIKGINEDLLEKIVQYFNKKYDVKIISEKKIYGHLKKNIIKINPNNIHKLLIKCRLLISDSQSMTMEAAMLGIPSIRISDFVRKIGVLEELEYKYHLTYGIKTNETEKIFKILNYLFSYDDLNYEFSRRRNQMLKDKINVSEFFSWLIDQFPKSIYILNKNPNYQLKYR